MSSAPQPGGMMRQIEIEDIAQQEKQQEVRTEK
jgi:hypothetical protein